MVEPSVGLQFASFKEWEIFYKEFIKVHQVPFYISDSRKIEKARIQDQDSLNPELKYYQCLYTCINGGRKFISRSKGQKQGSSFKLKRCPVKIRLKAGLDNKLTVVEVNLNHNHSTQKKILNHLRHHRKLTSEEKKNTEYLLQMRAHKKLIAEELKNKTGKQVTLKDLSNIRPTNNARDNKVNLNRVVNTLTIKYGSQVRLLTSETNEFQGILFISESMKTTFNEYPEFFCIDATFKLLDIRAPVYLTLIEDGNGESHITSVAILMNENKQSLEWMIKEFQSINSNYVNTKAIMADKDWAERNVLKTLFPDAEIKICLFHSLRSFQREITRSKLQITKEERQHALKLFETLALTKNQVDFDKAVEEMKNLPKCIFDYLKKNWLPIKNEWSVSYGLMNSTFLNRTNNRLEQFNAKLKTLIKRYSALDNFIENLFHLLSSTTTEIEHRAAMSFLRVPATLCDASAVKIKYYSYLTLYGYKQVENELNIFENFTYVKEIHKENDYYTITTIYNNIYKVNRAKCTCAFFRSIALPCRHIFVIRKLENCSLFDEQLCNVRWSKEKYTTYLLKFSNKENNIHTQQENITENDVLIDNNYKKKTNKLSCQQKFHNAFTELKAIAEIISEMSQERFEQEIEYIKNYRCRLEQEYSKDNPENETKDQNDNPVEMADEQEDEQKDENPVEMADEQEDEQKDENPVEMADEQEDEQEDEQKDENQIEKIIMPTRIKRRGRPKGMEKTFIEKKKKT